VRYSTISGEGIMAEWAFGVGTLMDTRILVLGFCQ
jgi:hypothetical protein